MSTSQICATIPHFTGKQSFLPQIEVIHSGTRSLFSSNEYSPPLKGLKVKKSRSSAKAYQNQFVEKINRTIKDILRLTLEPAWTKKRPDLVKEENHSFEQISSIVRKGIEIYNQSPHSALGRLSPNQIKEALFLKHRDKHPENVGELITANNDSLIAVAINEYKRQVAVEYQGDWTKFFLEWRAKQEKFQTKLFEEIRKNRQRAEQKVRKITNQR